MDLFDLEELFICPWALREGVILRRLDALSTGLPGRSTRRNGPGAGPGPFRVPGRRLVTRATALLGHPRAVGRRRGLLDRGCRACRGPRWGGPA